MPFFVGIAYVNISHKSFQSDCVIPDLSHLRMKRRRIRDAGRAEGERGVRQGEEEEGEERSEAGREGERQRKEEERVRGREES